MGDRGVRTSLYPMSARKSAPSSAGGVNSRRLAAARASRLREERHLAQQLEEKAKKEVNMCGNPFCGQILANRYAKFCEERVMCQRYRALKIQCQANQQAEDEEDERPLSLLRRKKKKKKDKVEIKQKEKEGTAEPFAIPRRKLSTKKRHQVEEHSGSVTDGEETNSTGLRRKNLLKKKKLVERLEELDEQQEVKKDKKKYKRAREALSATLGSSSTSTSNDPSSQASPVSSDDEPLIQPSGKRNKIRDSRLRRGSRETNSDAEGKSGMEVGRSKRRRLNRQISADDVLMRSASSSPIPAATATPSTTALSSDGSWKIPRSRAARPTTAAQAIKRMGVEPVPLGVSNQSVNFAGGGRYVQSGNRSGAQSTRMIDARPQPNKTKFVSSKPTISPVGTSASASSSNAPFRPTPPTIPSAPPQSSPPPQPPLPSQAPPHTPSLPPPMPQPMAPARTVTPSSSPVRQVVAESDVVPSSNATPGTTTVASRMTVTTTDANGKRRISASDYLKKMNRGRQSGARGDLDQSRAPSLGRSSGLTDEHSSGFPPIPTASSSFPSRPPNDDRNDWVPPPPPTSSVDFRIRDSCRPYAENREQYPHQQATYNHGGGRMNHPGGYVNRGRSMSNGYTTWSPPRDYYPPRPQSPSSFSTNAHVGRGSYEYDADAHFSPHSSPPDQSYWRDQPRSELPHQRPPPYNGPGRMENERGNSQFTPYQRPERIERDRDSGGADEDEDMPIFSYHEAFTSRLLSIFIDKFPHALEAVRNVTKKPRKMIWYVQYVERIERLCKPHDVQVKFQGMKATVMVYGREWLTLKGQSTVALHMEVIKHLLDEALTWRQLREEAEGAYKHYRSIYQDQTKLNIAFLRAWNDIKREGKLSLARQANYFCGARLHHWNFVVGKVEIGSGSHEDKREAFRLATISALDFLLSLGRLRQRQDEGFSEVRQTRPSESEELSAREQRPSESRDSSVDNSARELPISEHTDTPSTGPPSSPVTIERSKNNNVAVIPSTDTSNSSHETATSAEQSDPGEEMSISDGSDVDISSVPNMPSTTASTLATPAPAQPTTAPSPVVASTAQFAISAPTLNNATGPSPSLGTATTKTAVGTPVAAPSTELGKKFTSATNEGISALDVTKKDAVDTSRRCMMCEMIRMRKPDGERCLRCQQNDANCQARTVPGA